MNYSYLLRDKIFNSPKFCARKMLYSFQWFITFHISGYSMSYSKFSAFDFNWCTFLNAYACKFINLSTKSWGKHPRLQLKGNKFSHPSHLNFLTNHCKNFKIGIPIKLCSKKLNP